MDSWQEVFKEVIGRVDLKFAVKEMLPLIRELPSLKNPFVKRKKGNTLVTSMAGRLGEEGFDSEPILLKLILSICHDTNYKI